MERLHPVVLDTYGEERCRSFVTQEILQLENYEQTGEAIGPIIRAFQTATGSTAAQTYEVTVAFDYRGQHYEDTALFGLSGETMYWFGECR